MKNQRTGISRICTLLRRAFADVLLLGIVYSATFGTIHSHLDQSFPVAGFEAKAAGIAVSHAGISQEPLRGNTDGTECLTCILHRQFSSSTLNSPIFLVGASAGMASGSAPTVYYKSISITSRPLTRLRGRAPPQLA